MKINIKPAFEVTDEAVENMGCIFAYELREKGIEGLYTRQQMIKFAEGKCSEMMSWYSKSTGDVENAAKMMNWINDQFMGARE